jgi:hypothetical protein
MELRFRYREKEDGYVQLAGNDCKLGW